MQSSPLAYSYIRMSTDLQLKGDSLRRQMELSRSYAEKRNFTLVPETEMQDIGVSAYRGSNIKEGALGNFLRKVKEGAIPEGSYLLVESLDRLSRQDILNSNQLLLDLINQGITVVTLQDGKEYAKARVDMGDLITSLVIMSRAHEESRAKSLRLSAAWETKRGRIAEQKLTSRCPAWLEIEPDRKAFRILEKRSAIVRRIFEDTDAGMGSYLLTKRLNEEGVKPFGRSALWVESYVAKILQNRAVIGEFQPHRIIDGKRVPEGDPMRGYFPAVIEENLFYRVQEVRRSRIIGAAGRRGPLQRNLFTNIARCGYCGSPMHFLNKGEGSKGGQYLRCGGSLAGSGCVKTAWKYEDFEKSFLFFVSEIDLDSVLNAAHRANAKREHEAAKKGLKEKLRQDELKYDRLMELLGDERQDVALLSDRLAKVAEQKRQTEQELRALSEPYEGDRNERPSKSDLLEIIESVRCGPNGDTLKKRIKLAEHLRMIITSLRLEVEGNKPRRHRRRELMGDDLGPFELQVLEHIRANDEQFQNDQPQFTVIFANGRKRLLRVKKDAPLSVIDEISLRGDLLADFFALKKSVEEKFSRYSGSKK